MNYDFSSGRSVDRKKYGVEEVPCCKSRIILVVVTGYNKPEGEIGPDYMCNYSPRKGNVADVQVTYVHFA